MPLLWTNGPTDDVSEMTDTLLAAHRTAQRLAGPDYEQFAEPVRALIRTICQREQCSPLSACLRAAKVSPLSAGELLWLSAAAIDVINERTGPAH